MNTKQPERNPELVRVGATVKALRELRGLTQDQLSAAATMSRSQLANIEAGRKSCSLLATARLAQALGVPSVAIKNDPVTTPKSVAEQAA